MTWTLSTSPIPPLHIHFFFLFTIFLSCWLSTTSIEDQAINHQPGDQKPGLQLLPWLVINKATDDTISSIVCFAQPTALFPASGLSHIFLPLPQLILFHSQTSLVNLYMSYSSNIISEKTFLKLHAPKTKTLIVFTLFFLEDHIFFFITML